MFLDKSAHFYGISANARAHYIYASARHSRPAIGGRETGLSCHTVWSTSFNRYDWEETKSAARVLAVAYFVMVWIGKSERREVLSTHIVETAKRIYGAPEFFYYAHPCYRCGEEIC